MALSLFIILLFVISLFFSFLLKAISLDVFVGRRMKFNKKNKRAVVKRKWEWRQKKAEKKG